MSKFCLNPACRKPRNPEHNGSCHGCGANLADSTQSYRFDYYRVTKLLGKGGFGRTYLAEYSRRFNQHRVIKTLITRENEQNQRKINELFAREAEQLGNLDHPQIPKLYEYFEGDNNLYLVQEFIDGMSLSEEFQQQGPFQEQKIQTILEELLPILVYIEEQNLLHRDIKPDNIMRRRSDGVLMLIDFGAARVKTGRDPTILTTIYTPGYAAMEHMMGRPVKASDVYSLGITCIRLLTGCFLFGTTDPIYDDHNNCLRWKEYLQERNITISDQLVAILDKMVASSLKDRYPDAQAVLEDLLLPNSTVPSTLILNYANKVYKKDGKLEETVKITNSIPENTNVKTAIPDLTSQWQEEADKLRQEEINRSYLISKKTGLDYTSLQELLAAEKWKEADAETARMMFKAAGREKQGWLREEDIKKFSCEDLRIIDQLWLDSSLGKFGLSVQKEIWHRNGSPTIDAPRENWRKFYIDVGWKNEESEIRTVREYLGEDPWQKEWQKEDLGDNYKGEIELTIIKEGFLPLRIWRATFPSVIYGLERGLRLDILFSRCEL